MRTTDVTRARTLLNKVPQVTLAFWVIKIMATTVGETAADFLNVDLNLGLSWTSLVMTALLAVALGLQLRARRYLPSLYWIAVVLISVVGTLITDNITDRLGVPLALTTAAFAMALAATFAAWYAQERTLSIHTIGRTRRELYYWAAILFTFALGTAAGDLLAESLQLGYLNAMLLFALGLALVTITHLMFGLNAVLAFWVAYVLTRPFGASFGDLLSQSVDDGGLGLGTTLTSALFLLVIACLVVLMSLRERRQAARNTDTSARRHRLSV